MWFSAVIKRNLFLHKNKHHYFILVWYVVYYNDLFLISPLILIIFCNYYNYRKDMRFVFNWFIMLWKEHFITCFIFLLQTLKISSGFDIWICIYWFYSLSAWKEKYHNCLLYCTAVMLFILVDLHNFLFYIVDKSRLYSYLKTFKEK